MQKLLAHVFVIFVVTATSGSDLVAQTNICIHPNPTASQFEQSIATHPSDPNIVLVASVTYSGIADDRFGWYYTTDGGRSWSGHDTLATQTNFSTYMRDPAVGIDLAGNLFIMGMYGADVFVARSTNGGASWLQTTVATTSGHEKPHMTIDRNPESPYRNYIYSGYTDLNLASHPVMFSRSTDQGQSFAAPIPISGGVGASMVGVNLAVGPDSSLYATWSGFDSSPWINPVPLHLGFNRSTDGGLTWGTARPIGLINYNGGLPRMSFFNYPSMAVDGSASPRQGWIYIVYTERNPAAPDVFLIRSTDRGDSWSLPVKVNQDTSGMNQWQPWACVDPQTGTLFVSYYDSRNFPTNDSAQVYVSASTDGGQTFRDSLVSDVPFLPRAVHNWLMVPNYMGSYLGIAALNNIVWPVWTDTRTGIHQAYTERRVITSVREVTGNFPPSFALEQNYPNPFNPTTTIRYALPRRSRVTLTVYNMLGQQIAALVNGEIEAGYHVVQFKASNLASGVYFYRLHTPSFVQTRKLLVLR